MDDTARQDQADVEQPTSLPEENQNNSAPEQGDQSQSNELPDGVADRTREQFEKLKESNKRLKAELEATKAPKKTLVDELYPHNHPTTNQKQFQNLPEQQVAQVTQNFVDEEGYLDVAALNSELSRLNQLTQEAQRAAMSARQEIERSQQDEEMRKAHSLYPQLDPESPDFNQDFYDMTKKHVVGQMYEYGRGSLLTAAQAVAKLMSTTESKAKAEQSREQDVQRREIATSNGSSAKRPSNNLDLDELRKRSIAGDMDAISARLKASGY